LTRFTHGTPLAIERRMSLAATLLLAHLNVISLADAVHQAMRAQPQLAQAAATTRAAIARVGEARAPLLPQLSGNAIWNVGNDPRHAGTSAAMTKGAPPPAAAQSWSLEVTAAQTIWDGSGGLARLDAARALAVAAADSAEATRLQLWLAVEQQYFAACAARRLVDVARATLANQDKHLGQIAGFVRAGARAEIDLAQANSDRANAEVQRISAENGYALAKAQLAQSLGGVTGDFEVEDAQLSAVAGEQTDPEALLKEALRARPELAAADAQLRAQGLTVLAAKETFGPSLALNASATEAGGDAAPSKLTWSVGATLNWSLFSGGLSYYTTREAQATRDSLAAQRAVLVLQLRFQLVQAQLNVRAAEQASIAAGKALENTREQLRLAEGRYQSGVGSVIELGDAQLAFSNASAQQVQAQYSVYSSRAALLAALGRYQ
jgi:outer membrane protein